MNIQWWCAASGQPWDGSWQAYPGVWFFTIAVAAAFWRLRIRDDGAHPLRRVAIPIAVFLLWVTLDWPLGPLGAGYLSFVHSLQFLSLAMIVPPLLLLGVDTDRVRAALAQRPALETALSRATQPLIALVLFALTMVVTHLPGVVDALMASQAGAFALDFAWFFVGLVFWWPVVVRVPARKHFPPPMQMLYIFFGTQPHLYLAMWLLATDFPAYATYELAPRIGGLSAQMDQQIAGALMLGFGATFIIGVITIVFFRWAGSVGAKNEA